MSLLNTIQKIAENVVKAQNLTDITFGKVKSIDPLEIVIMSNKITLTAESLILTEGVVRKEIHIGVHTHIFDNDTFKHSHSDGNKLILGTDWDIKALMYMGGLVAPAPSAAVPPASMSIQGSASTGQIDLKNGQKQYDLTHDDDRDFETLPVEEPTKSTLQVRVNGVEIPLSKDPDGETEGDEDGTDMYWGVLNHGLYPDDMVILLKCLNGSAYVVLSKVYGSWYSREDEE